MSVKVHTEGRVLRFSSLRELNQWGEEHPNAPLDKVFIETDVHLKPRSDFVMKTERRVERSNHGRFDPKNPAVQELAAEYGLTPEEYLADPNAHSGRQNEVGELDTTIDEWRTALEVRDDPGQTINEIVEATGVAPSTVRRKIKKLIKGGKCVKGEATRYSPCVDAGTGGYKVRYHVYQLLGEEK